MIKFKIKLEDIYKSLLIPRTTYWDLIHTTSNKQEIKLKDLKETHIKNIIKLIKKKQINDVEVELQFEIIEFQPGFNAFVLNKGQKINISEIENNYYNNLMF